MKIIKIVTISALGILLSACGHQMQVEGSAPAVDGMGPAHIHNIQDHGDFLHQHKGNSTANHSHSWEQIQNELKNQ